MTCEYLSVITFAKYQQADFKTDGRGTGECRKLSVNNPANIRTSIKLKAVHKFDKDGVRNFHTGLVEWNLTFLQQFGTVHITDLTDIYVRLVSRILKQEPIQVGHDRYFFAIAHKAHWWKIADKIAEGLYSRGLVTEPKAKIWSDYQTAADSLGFPRAYIGGYPVVSLSQQMCTSWDGSPSGIQRKSF
jgi:hypothetical protein